MIGTALNVALATDAEIEEFVEGARRADRKISLEVPFTKQACEAFFASFECQRCGLCCNGLPLSKPTGIQLHHEEVVRLAQERNMSTKRFKEAHTFTIGKDRHMSYPCTFFLREKHECSIYARRPVVCRVFPLGVVRRGNVHTMETDSECPASRRMVIQTIQQIRHLHALRKGLQQHDLST